MILQIRNDKHERYVIEKHEKKTNSTNTTTIFFVVKKIILISFRRIEKRNKQISNLSNNMQLTLNSTEVFPSNVNDVKHGFNSRL